MLIEYGAGVKAIKDDEYVIEDDEYVIEDDEWTPLHVAAQNGNRLNFCIQEKKIL